MSNVPTLKPSDLIRLLMSKGFVLDRVSGSHHIYIHPTSHKRVTVPFHKKDLPTGTMLAILKQAGITKDEL
jgi:predicted RNA binding protein YcfA (HicA-like mRNA interferase family)